MKIWNLLLLCHQLHYLQQFPFFEINIESFYIISQTIRQDSLQTFFLSQRKNS